MIAATSADVTRITEDYLALVWKVCEQPDDGHHPNTADLTAALGVAPSTVSANLKCLAGEGMIKYRPYSNIELTEEGERVGRAVVRRHRIIETCLVTSLGIPWDQVHDEADQFEYAVSKELVDWMDEVPSHPDVDPHGSPISRNSNANHPEVALIAHTTAGVRMWVMWVSDSDPEVPRSLAERGVTIGTRLEVPSGPSGMGLMAADREGVEIELGAPVAEVTHATPAN